MARTVATGARQGTAAVLAALMAALAAPAPAGAEPKEIFTHASGGAGACGGWWQETVEAFETVSVCGLDGVVAEDGRVVRDGRPTVLVDLYACSKPEPVTCTEEHHEGEIGHRDLRVDPLLRTARIRTRVGSCPVDVHFWAVGPTRPEGGVWEYHGYGDVSVGAGQTLSREAQWTGTVCARQLRGAGEAWMWRGAGASVGRGAGGEHGEGGH